MKKIFIFAATAALLASCAQDEVLNSYEPTAEQAIGFSTITNLQTRAENSTQENKLDLYNYHETFVVDGFKCVNATTKGVEVFKGQVVNVASNNTTSYEPAKYWDKAASYYNFYAAAPATGWTFVAPTDLTTPDLTTGYYTTSSTLAGDNITTITGTDAYKYQEYFNKDGDLDKLIASPCKVENSWYNKSTGIQDVELDFNHILSRLNVEVKSAIEPVYNQLTVTVETDADLPLFSYATDKLCVKSDGKYYQVTKHDDGTYSYTLSGEARIEVTETVTEVKDESVAVSGKVELVGIYVYNLVGNGSFSEDLTTAGINETELKNGTIKRWNVSSASTTETISNNNLLDLSVPTSNNIAVSDYKYVCQSLVIPQTLHYENINLDGTTSSPLYPYLNVQFKIDGQPYSYFYNLAAAFSNIYADYIINGRKAYKCTDDSYLYSVDGDSFYEAANDATATTKVLVFTDGTNYWKEFAQTTPLYESEGKYYTDENHTSSGFTADKVVNITPATRLEMSAIDTDELDIDFNEGWQNNLKINIGSSEIKFVGDVYKWADRTPDGTIDIQ